MGRKSTRGTNLVQLEQSAKAIMDKFMPVNTSVVLSLSGGVDSIVLLHLLSTLRPDLNVHAYHLNHKLREQADNDARLCQSVCNRLGIPLDLRECDISALTSQIGQGVEVVAREVRISQICEIKDRIEAKHHLSGHHANDRAETIFHNLLRGAGLSGLSALPEVNKTTGALRPLITSSKKDIYAYATLKGFRWAEDHTNAESAYTRNWIRNDVIPLLQERFPNVVSKFTDAANIIDEANDYVAQEALKYLQEHSALHHEEDKIDRSTLFDLSDYSDLHPFMQKELARQIWIRVYGDNQDFSADRADELSRWARRNKGNGSRLYFGDGVKVVKRAGRLGLSIENPDLSRKFWKDNSIFQIDNSINSLNMINKI